MSVYELLAAAREAQGTNYVKGDGIFCEKRFRKETAHMVEFLIREGQDAFGGKGEYHRKFLTEKEYQNILLQVQGPSLCYTPVPDSPNIGKNTPKRITNWEKR